MANKLIEFTFEIHADHGRTPPRIRVLNTEIELDQGLNVYSVTIPDSGKLLIDFYSKQESDTVVENGEIVKDTQFRINKIWIDGILVEPWFKNIAVYKPKYFPGFLTQFPDSQKEIVAPYQFNFPGTIEWQWEPEFWDWYFVQKNQREVINFLEIDPDRVWKFRGSLDNCDDLVSKIKEIIKL